MIENGIILKGIGGFYYVKTDRNVIETRARGLFRKQGIKPLAGDRITVENGYIIEIQPRKNVLIRPPVANIDALGIVISSHLPVPDMVLTDKLIIYGLSNDLETFLIINKNDLNNEVSDEIRMQYNDSGIKVFQTSAETGLGMDELKGYLHDKITCLTGQSAVGKSSIINSVLGEDIFDTGSLINKTDKGKQTTRKSELVFSESLNGGIIDTPGFNIFDCIEMEPEQLSAYYSEFNSHLNCKFQSCLHYKEAGCAVKEAVDAGKINMRRYNRYIVILKELIQRRLTRYD